MQITHNGKKYNIPASISEITLKQVIDFQSKYGNELQEFQKNVDKDDELENFEISMDIACKSVSFFSGIPLDEIYKTDLNQIASIYFNVISPIFQSQEERELRDVYYFADDLWTIESPELTFNNSMSFNEMILGKEITNDLQKFAIGKYDALQRLCTIYFRKVDVDDKIEKFNEEWMQENSERMELMAELTMDIVLDVAFFLQSSMSIWIKHSRSLESQKEERTNLTKHFEKWGWVSFMVYVAENATIFYKQNGKSNLDNIKETKAYDVMIWSSEKKDMEENLNQYYESMS